MRDAPELQTKFRPDKVLTVLSNLLVQTRRTSSEEKSFCQTERLSIQLFDLSISLEGFLQKVFFSKKKLCLAVFKRAREKINSQFVTEKEADIFSPKKKVNFELFREGTKERAINEEDALMRRS